MTASPRSVIVIGIVFIKIPQMRFAVYFFRGLVEFIFGSFVPQSGDRIQPINPVGPIEGKRDRSKDPKVEHVRSHEEIISSLEKCFQAEYKFKQPTRGDRDCG